MKTFSEFLLEDGDGSNIFGMRTKTPEQRIAGRYVPKDYKIYREEPGVGIVYWHEPSPDSMSTKFLAMAYSGKKGKPDWHYSFRTKEQLDKRVEEHFASLARSVQYKKEREAQKAADRAKGHTFVVGDILYTSWGYDQTNVNFYQVVDATKNTIDVVEIGIKSVEQTSWASDRVEPDPKDRGTKKIRARVSGDSAKIDGHYAWKWNSGTTKHRSWYA